MASSILAPLQQILASNGSLASGYKVFVYTAGTTTKINTYPTAADADAGTNANTNPVVLNARGEPTAGEMWIQDSVTAYKLVLALPADTDPPTTPVRTLDEQLPVDIGLRGDLAATGGAAMVGVDPSGTVQTALDARVVGPSSVTTNKVALFDGTTGKLLKEQTGDVAGAGEGAFGLVSYATAAEAAAKTSAVTVMRPSTMNAALRVPTSRTATDDITLALTDAQSQIIVDSGSARTVTIPLNASVAFAVGDWVIIFREGSGEVSITGTGGVTVRAVDGHSRIDKRYQAVYLRKQAEDTWELVGPLKASA